MVLLGQKVEISTLNAIKIEGKGSPKVVAMKKLEEQFNEPNLILEYPDSLISLALEPITKLVNDVPFKTTFVDKRTGVLILSKLTQLQGIVESVDIKLKLSGQGHVSVFDCSMIATSECICRSVASMILRESLGGGSTRTTVGGISSTLPFESSAESTTTTSSSEVMVKKEENEGSDEDLIDYKQIKRKKKTQYKSSASATEEEDGTWRRFHEEAEKILHPPTRTQELSILDWATIIEKLKSANASEATLALAEKGIQKAMMKMNEDD
jgi:hypothetical protein